jgi:CSLREA domain-containing protein
LKCFVSTLLAAVCLLAVPAVAGAAEYEVNTANDEADAAPGTAGCLTTGLVCSLRAAIQESNASVGTKDTIKFAAAFDGQVATDTIAISGAFPIITDFVTIDGDGTGQCEPIASINGPCVGVEKTGGGFGLQVEDDEVTIEGLAVTGALIGINVINASEDFVARNNWVGLKLDGTTGANNVGIFVDPGSDDAVIGGNEATQRNVISSNSNIGLDLEGTSEAVVRGNYFGVTPSGAAAAGNPIDIDLTDSTAGLGTEAIGNEIGGGISPAQAATAACDGGCNVISGATLGIDLEGTGGNEAPASGPTTIRGNYIGLNEAGTAGLENSSTGVAIGGADEVTVGGNLAEHANHVHGGTFGVQAGGLGPDPEKLLVQGNLFGLNPAGTATLAASTGYAIFSDAEGMTDETLAATISANRISMIAGTAILQHGSGATITGNTIGRGVGGESLGGGSIGFHAYGNQSFGSTLEGNTFNNAAEYGVLIEDDENVIAGNQIGAAGITGVLVKGLGPAIDNVIGGDSPAEQNTITGSDGDAIAIFNDEDEENEIARNVGGGNTGLFIDLGVNGPGNLGSGPNDGAQPPVISTATDLGASGTTEPGALVRVFRKATPAAGELEAFIGEALANGEGKWSLTYGSPIPGGTTIGATQSDAGGTSELAFATTVATPSGNGGGKGGGIGNSGGNTGGKGAAKDKTPPQTTIRKGPKKGAKAGTVKFKFVSSEPGSTFQCKLDKRPFKPCKPPKAYKGLKAGKHVFKVWAIDKAGNVDPTPAKKKFKLVG